MKIYIICIGTELLNGRTLNTNLLTAGRLLADNGYPLLGSVVIPDKKEIISSTVKECLEKNDFIIVIGGLGPTDDDVTLSAVSDAVCVPICFSEQVCQTLRLNLQLEKDNLLLIIFKDNPKSLKMPKSCPIK